MAGQRFQIRHSAFQPDADPADLSALRDAYLAVRQDHGERTLAIFAKVAPDTTREAVGKGLATLLKRVPESADSWFEDPVFSTWAHFLSRAVTRKSSDEIRLHCGKLPEVLERVKSRLTGEESFHIPSTSIALQQTDVDPYVMAATPPSYDFMATLNSENKMNGHGHPLRLQQELMGFAMQNIEKAWSELKAQITEVVKIIGYLPDATFRSCSAARYAGVVYIGNMDERLLDLEESIVHEAGHQVLYRLGEIVPLVKDGTPQDPDYELPWSGSKRDLFGFLHAFYIYSLLTKYLWRRAAINDDERNDCVQRAVLILIGARLAIPMLLGDHNLTDQGRALVKIIATDMDALQSEIEEAYKGVVKDHA